MTEAAPDAVDELFERLVGHANDPRRRRSLALIHRICQEQADRGSADFQLTTIGRLSEKEGGPSAAALRNPGAAIYRDLIHAHAERAGRRRSRTTPADSDWKQAITDPVARARAGAQEEELRLATRKARALQSVLNARQAPPPPSPPAGAEGSSGARLALDLLPSERRLLTQGLSLERLVRSGLKTDAAGNVSDRYGNVLFSARFLDLHHRMVAAVLEAERVH